MRSEVPEGGIPLIDFRGQNSIKKLDKLQVRELNKFQVESLLCLRVCVEFGENVP